MTVTVFEFDAFTTVPGKGNPAGVVFDAQGLTRDQMQAVALKTGFNETVFVLPSTIADCRLRFFTPGHEINLCGHATTAAVFAYAYFEKLARDIRSVETNIGVLPVRLTTQPDGSRRVEMRQGRPDFLQFVGETAELMHAIGLRNSDLDNSLPIVFGSTGTWTVLIPIKRIDRFAHMKPHNTRFPGILHQLPHASLHPFSLESFETDNTVYARHFSSMFSGTTEDAVTGTASGVIAAFLLEYFKPGSPSISFSVRQGVEMGREGRVYVRANKNGFTEVYTEGDCVFVREFPIKI